MIKKELYAIVLILLAFWSGMVLTAATSGCDSRGDGLIQPLSSSSVPVPAE